MAYSPSLTDAEIAEIKRRFVEHRMRPVSAALRDPARVKPEREIAGQGQMNDDLYWWRRAKLHPDAA